MPHKIPKFPSFGDLERFFGYHPGNAFQGISHDQVRGISCNPFWGISHNPIQGISCNQFQIISCYQFYRKPGENVDKICGNSWDFPEKSSSEPIPGNFQGTIFKIFARFHQEYLDIFSAYSFHIHYPGLRSNSSEHLNNYL